MRVSMVKTKKLEAIVSQYVLDSVFFSTCAMIAYMALAGCLCTVRHDSLFIAQVKMEKIYKVRRFVLFFGIQFGCLV